MLPDTRTWWVIWHSSQGLAELDLSRLPNLSTEIGQTTTSLPWQGVGSCFRKCLSCTNKQSVYSTGNLIRTLQRIEDVAREMVHDEPDTTIYSKRTDL